MKWIRKILQQKFRAILIIVIFTSLASMCFGQQKIQGLTINGTDPTEIRSRIDVILAQLTSFGDNDYIGTVFGGQFAFNHWLAAAIDFPIVYARLSGSTAKGVGDMRLHILTSLHQGNKEELMKSAAFGFTVYLNTGDADRGTGIGQTVYIPALAVSYKIAEELSLIPGIEYYDSVGSTGDHISELRLTIDSIINFDSSIWVQFAPDAIFDFTGNRITTYNIESTLGKMIDDNRGFAATFSSNIAGDSRVQQNSHIGLRYLF